MIEWVADDHASIPIHNNTPHRMIELAVPAAKLTHHPHMRTISVSQNVNSMRSVLDDNHVNTVVKRESCGERAVKWLQHASTEKSEAP
jgi:hypothetical protein